MHVVLPPEVAMSSPALPSAATYDLSLWRRRSIGRTCPLHWPLFGAESNVTIHRAHHISLRPLCLHLATLLSKRYSTQHLHLFSFRRRGLVASILSSLACERMADPSTCTCPPFWRARDTTTDRRTMQLNQSIIYSSTSHYTCWSMHEEVALYSLHQVLIHICKCIIKRCI
jgi:hypothetical protein